MSVSLIDHLVLKFLNWNLPQDVCCDPCVIDKEYKFPRNGTNLLTYDQTKEMIIYLFGTYIDKVEDAIQIAEKISDSLKLIEEKNINLTGTENKSLSSIIADLENTYIDVQPKQNSIQSSIELKTEQLFQNDMVIISDTKAIISVVCNSILRYIEIDMSSKPTVKDFIISFIDTDHIKNFPENYEFKNAFGEIINQSKDMKEVIANEPTPYQLSLKPGIYS